MIPLSTRLCMLEPEAMQKVSNAFCIALHQHSVVAKVKTRKYSDQPYIVHPVRVAIRAAEHPYVRAYWICAALLHDTVEDTIYSYEEEWELQNRIEKGCGVDTFNLVMELTNENHDKKTTNRRQRKLLDWARLGKVSSAAKIIKMLDRIDNLNEMSGAPGGFRVLYLKESQELLKVVGDADPELATILQQTIDKFAEEWA
jgi:(p)ppGpp synthase/HD superfamily hydrolase